MGRDLTVVELPTALGAPPNAPRTAPSILNGSPWMQRVRSMHTVHTDRIEVPQSPTSPVAGLSSMISRIRQRDKFRGMPLFFGGDHTASLASVNAVASDTPTGVLWIDAHPDYNTRATSPSGNPHGMVLAGLVGDGPRPEWQASALTETNIAIVGVRSVDPGERQRLRESNISIFTMEDIRQQGLPTILLEAWDVVTEQTDQIHLSLDLDVFDPRIAPGVNTRVPNGLSAQRAEVLATWFSERNQAVDSLDIVELNPLADHHHKTADLAGRFVHALVANR